MSKHHKIYKILITGLSVSFLPLFHRQLPDLTVLVQLLSLISCAFFNDKAKTQVAPELNVAEGISGIEVV